MNNLNMNIFRNKKKELENLKLQIFEKFYIDTIKTIELHANNLKEFCIYQIPLFVFGKSNYNISEAIIYLKNKLDNDINNGNLKEVIIYEPNILYISWSLD